MMCEYVTKSFVAVEHKTNRLVGLDHFPIPMGITAHNGFKTGLLELLIRGTYAVYRNPSAGWFLSDRFGIRRRQLLVLA